MWPFWTWLLACQLVVVVTLTSGVDYPTCIDNFDIHKDKIIRTEDSRQLGAKYLNELELASREQCLKVCCQTESCDVFVFEEKSPGSCYLFHCGGPENFKCKFTKHHNYTSGILSAAQHLAELEAQIRLTKHEKELTRLRKPDTTEASSSVEVTEKPLVVSPESPQLVTQEALTISTNSPPIAGVSDSNSAPILTVNPGLQPAAVAQPSSAASTKRQCSHFQFECRETHECIGIYNACDGVEQCADGSDEAPELNCPQQESAAPAAPPQPPSVKMVPTSSVTANSPNKAPAEFPMMTSILHNHQIHSDTKMGSSGAIPAPVPPPEGLIPAKVAPASPMNADNHLELLQPVQALQPIPLPPPQPPPYNINPLRIYSSENQAISPDNRGRQQIESPFDEKTSITYNNDGDLVGNIWPKTGLPQSYPVASIPSQSPLIALPRGNSHIFTHKGNGLVAEKERYRENPTHHVDYNNVVDSLGQDYTKYSLELPPSINNVGESALPPFRSLSPTIYNPNTWPRMPIASQNMHGVFRPAAESEQDQMDPLRNRLTGLDLSAGVNAHPQVPIPPDYFEETPGKLHALEEAAAMAAVINSGGSPRMTSGTSHHLSSLESSIQDFGNVVHDMTAFQEKLNQNYPIKLNSPKIEPKEMESKVTRIKPKPTTSTIPETTPSLSYQETSKFKEESPVAAVSSLEARVSEEDLVIETRSSNPSGAILSLALGLCLSGILAGLVGCRLRMVRRRLRRVGKSSYAHDADFLVNGMYL